MQNSSSAAEPVVPESLVALRDVSVEFGSLQRTRVPKGQSASTVALSSVNLEIGRGEFVAIVGATGCGKTTLLNLISGLVRPTEGTVTVSGAAPKVGNPRVSYMFARDALLPWRTVQKNVELSLEPIRRMSRSQRRDLATDWLKRVGLEEFSHLRRNQLSQGMRQRVALARTMVRESDIVLMDEPFGALDARTKLALQREFLALWESLAQERTIIFVTHDLQEAALLADRVVVMLPRPGRISVDQRIPIPRPRGKDLSDIMFSEEFREIHHALFHRLEGDANI